MRRFAARRLCLHVAAFGISVMVLAGGASAAALSAGAAGAGRGAGVAGGVAAVAGGAAAGVADPAAESPVVEGDPGASVPLGTVVRALARSVAVRAAGAGTVARSAAVGPAGAGTTDPLAVEVVQTSANLVQHLTRLRDLEFQAVPSGGAPVTGSPVIQINDQVRYQRVGGFGAAMTDASAWLLHDELPASVGGLP